MKSFLQKRILYIKIWVHICIYIFLITFLFSYHFLKKVVDESLISLSNKQNISVEFSPEININDVSIKWTGFKDYSPSITKIVFSRNKSIKVPYCKGNNSFEVFYKNNIIKTIGHFVVSRFRYHNYILKIYTHDNILDCKFNVLGADSATYNEWNEWKELNQKNGKITDKNQKKTLILLHTDSTSIKNDINIALKPDEYKRIQKIGIDTSIKNKECTINGISHNIVKMKTRGQSSIYFKRKSFNITLDDSATFIDYKGFQKKMKSFSIISLCMDYCYYKNRIAYELLKEANLMNVFYSFTEMKMNSETQGLYLVIENPKKHLIDSLHSSFFIRRGYEYSSFMPYNYLSLSALINNIKGNKISFQAKDEMHNKDINDYVEQYKKIYKLIQKKEGNELYQSLKKLIDIEEYLRFMAFNYIICNHDYTDEQFFYISNINKQKYFNTLLWDFDDIFSDIPHEGWIKRINQVKNKMIFSCESNLDLKIANDPFIYKKYLIELNKVVNMLDTSRIRQIYQETYKELYPFYVKKEIIEQSKYDDSNTEYNLNELANELNTTYLVLLNRINSIRSKLNKVKI